MRRPSAATRRAIEGAFQASQATLGVRAERVKIVPTSALLLLMRNMAAAAHGSPANLADWCHVASGLFSFFVHDIESNGRGGGIYVFPLTAF